MIKKTNYVIMKECGKISSIQKYDNDKSSIKKIKELISKWTDDKRKPHLVENKDEIDILDYFYRYEEDHDLNKRSETLEDAIDDIKQITDRL